LSEKAQASSACLIPIVLGDGFPRLDVVAQMNGVDRR
jgi:hypothetical protein